MVSLRANARLVLLRLLLVAAVAVSHCCLLGHSAWAAGLHADGAATHGEMGPAAVTAWTQAPEMPMVCGGAHGVATARPAVPSPGVTALPVVAAPTAVGGPASRPVAARAHSPDPLPPSRAVLQTYLI
jgi:hypothetical protein